MTATETQTAKLSVSAEQFDRIRNAPAVAVSLYRSKDGLFSKLARIGTVAECEEYVNTPSLLLMLNGLEYLGSEVVLSNDLLPPDEDDEDDDEQ